MRIFLMIIAVALVGCATAAEKNDAQKAWGDCVWNAVVRLDDGKSDPVSIAYGVAPQCAVQYNLFTQMMVSENVTDAGRANMRQQMKDGELKLITSAILTYRASHKK